MLRIISAESAQAVREASLLFREYAASLGVDLGFQNFETELATLPGDYSPPAGRLFLSVRVESAVAPTDRDPRMKTASPAFFSSVSIVGCIALREFAGDICEMKRLFVRPAFRGCGAGRALAEAVIAAAREIGYRQMRLDTLPQMQQAQALYQALGFREIPPYRHNPVPGTRYFELTL
jgi:putative acetyltransferase